MAYLPVPSILQFELTVDQKFQALQVLSYEPSMVSIHRREGYAANIAWTMSVPGVYLRDTPETITSGVPSGASTPEGAIHAAWDWYTRLPKAPHQYVVTLSKDALQRKAYRWAGFMWQEIAEKADGR